MHTAPAYVAKSSQPAPKPEVKPQSSINEARGRKSAQQQFSIITLEEDAHRFDPAAQETITQFVNAVFLRGQPEKQASLEDILHVVQQDLDQQKKKVANAPLDSLLNSHLIDYDVSVKAYQAYALVHGREYAAKVLEPGQDFLQSYWSQNQFTANNGSVPDTIVARIAQVILNDLAGGSAFVLPNELCMLLAGVAGLIHPPILHTVQAEAEAQYALLHVLFMVHFISKHIPALGNEQQTDVQTRALQQSIEMLKSDVIGCACRKQPLSIHDELDLDKKSQPVLAKFYDFYESVLFNGQVMLASKFDEAVETRFTPLYSKLMQGLGQGNATRIIQAAHALLKASNSLILLAVALGKIKTDEVGDKTGFLTTLLEGEYNKLSIDERKAFKEKLGASKNIDEIMAALPAVGIRFAEDRPELSRDMTATAGLLSQVQEHLRMQDPLIGSRSQASTDPGNDAIDASPVTQKMENAIGIAFGVDVPPEPCLDSNASSGREEEVLNWGEFLKKYPEKSNREIGGAKSRNSQEEVVESEAIDLKKVKKTQGSPRTSGHKRIRDLMRDLSLKASGEIAISPDSSEGKASASVPTNSANESKPPFSFLADRPIIWKSKSAIVNGSTLLPMTGQTRLSVDELDEEIKTMLDYFINPFRLTGDLSSFLGGSSGTPRTTKDIAAIQWVNENSLIATMRITSNELSREANFPGKKLEQLLATIFRESSFATAALEAAMSHYGKKYAEGLLKPAWQKLEAVFRLRASKRTSLSIDSKNLNNDSTPGKVQDIQDIVQSIIESMIGVQTGKTDHATAKAGIHAASQAVPDKICMLLSGVTRQVAECAIDMLEKSELNKSLHLTPEELAARKNAIDAQARASIPTALLMLRLIGPAVVNKAVDLIPDHQRVLVLISKILQSIGNGASRQNDPVTSLFSTFIEKCQLPMQEFFAALLVRGDNLFTEIRVSMDLSAVSAEKRPAARSFAARMNAMIPKAIELIPASHLNSRLSDEEVLAGLLKILLLPDEPMAKQSMQPAPALTGQPQPGSGRSSPTLSPASAQQNSVSE